MKKIVMLFMVALLLFSLSGQAMAYFEDGHLIRVVYERGGTREIVTDLGAGWNPTSQLPASTNELFDTDNFSLAALQTGSWNNVYVAYFTVTTYNPSGTEKRVWASGPGGGQTSMSRQFDAFLGNAHYINGMNGLTGDAQNVNLQTDPNSYKNRFGSVGRFGGFLNSSSNGDKNLSALATADFVDQFLYYYGSPDLAKKGATLYNLRTYANGTTEINGVPVPPAVYLFGSSLLGLIGIRRRMVA